jgi:hypothetical protein
MLDEQELIDIETETLFIHDQRQRLKYHNDPTDPTRLAPRFYFARTRTRNIRRFRHDLPDEVAQKLDALFALEPIATDLREPLLHSEGFIDLLKTHAPFQRLDKGLAYHFPDKIPSPSTSVIRVTKENAELLRDGFPETIDELDLVQPCMVVVEDGRAVSLCHSVRLSTRAHEAGLETLAEYRRKGYAAAVVASWAMAVRDLDLIPFYSTSWENVASQGVARKLGLALWFC